MTQLGADKDLRLAVERAAAQLPGPPAGALLFTCNGRGRRMFGVADHDASTIEELLGGIPLAGFFAAGEIGPIAGRNALHGFTASMALFVEHKKPRNERPDVLKFPCHARHGDATRNEEERWQLRPISQRRNGTRCRRA